MYTVNGDNLLREPVVFDRVEVVGVLPGGRTVKLELNSVDTPSQGKVLEQGRSRGVVG